MREISKHSNLGDSLNDIRFNFSCLDIRLSNLQFNAATKYSKISLSEWTDSFRETLAMSANWESVKELVHNTSAFWEDQTMTIIYRNIFPSGRVRFDVIDNWIGANFPASNYKGVKANVVFYEWYKDPALHAPAKRSLKKFGKLSRENNVYIRNIHHLVYKESNGRWVRDPNNTLFSQKPNLTELVCGGCWGRGYYPEYPTCIEPPKYYKLEVLDCPEPPEPPSPCELVDGFELEWEFPDVQDLLEDDVKFQQLSGTDLTPYVLGKKNASNPDLEEVNEGVYEKFINNSAIPNLPDDFRVTRNFAYNLEYTYKYNSINNTFTKESILSSNNLTFNPGNVIDFPIGIGHLDLIKFLQAYGLGRVLNQSNPDCDFFLKITTSWHRWVTDNTSLSGTPYWHIGIEPGNSLGFNHNPLPGVPDPSANWDSAYSALGDSLSAYFGTQYDMMGKIINIELVTS